MESLLQTLKPKTMKLINLLVVLVLLASCKISKDTAERRIAKYVEMYPELAVTKLDTVYLPGNSIEVPVVETIIDTAALDSTLNVLADSLGVEMTKRNERVLRNARKTIAKQTIENVRSQLTQYKDTSGVVVDFTLSDEGKLDIVVTVPPKKIPVETQTIEVQDLAWYQKYSVYLAMGSFVLGLLFALNIKR